MPPALRQTATEGWSGAGIGTNIALPAPALAGSLLLVVLGIRNAAYDANTIGSGWTRVGYTHTAPGSLDSDSIGVWAKIAAGGEQVIDWNPQKWSASDPASGTIAEFSGFAALRGAQLAGANLAGAVATYPALVPAAPGAPAVLLRADWKKAALPNPGPCTLAGWSILGDTGLAGTGNRHRLHVFYLTTDALAASYPAAARSSSGDGADTGVVATFAAYAPAPAGFMPRFW